MVASAMPSDATEISKLRDQVKALQEQNADLLEQLARFQRFVYGNRSEEIHSVNKAPSRMRMPVFSSSQSTLGIKATRAQPQLKYKNRRKAKPHAKKH